VAAYLIPPIEIVNIKPWLEAKLRARGITAHKFASKMRVTSATIYRWYSDQYRPTPAILA
jgi:transcriptional regulator with XRE-family HTH domain